MPLTLRNGKVVSGRRRSNSSLETDDSDMAVKKRIRRSIRVSSVPSSPIFAGAKPLTVPLAVKSHTINPPETNAGPQWDQIIQVLVGPCRESFIAHETLLTKIPFFERCLRNDMQEASVGQVKLPEDDPAAFSEILHHAYFRTLSYDLPSMYSTSHKSKENINDPDPCILAEKLHVTIKLYVLAKKLGLESLQNLAISTLREAVRYVRLGPEALTLIDDNTEDDDPLRAMAMYCKAYDIKRSGWEVWKQGATYNTWIQGNARRGEMITAALATFVDHGAPHKQHPCRWHTHVDTPRCI